METKKKLIDLGIAMCHDLKYHTIRRLAELIKEESDACEIARMLDMIMTKCDELEVTTKYHLLCIKKIIEKL